MQVLARLSHGKARHGRRGMVSLGAVGAVLPGMVWTGVAGMVCYG